MPDTKRAHQIELEKLYSKNQLIPRIKSEFLNCEIDFKRMFKDFGVPEEAGFSFLVQIALHRRCKLDVMVGLLRNAAGGSQQAVEVIYKMLDLRLATWDQLTETLIVAIPIGRELQHELDKFQFPLPMVVEPEEVKSNKDTGYILNRGSIILKNNHHNDDVVLEHINKQNSIPLTINMDTATMVSNDWANMESPKDGESKDEYERRLRAFDKYNRTMFEVMDTLIKEENKFYVTWKYDKRGRCYSQGYHINPQGTSYNKAVVEFAEKEVVEL